MLLERQFSHRFNHAGSSSPTAMASGALAGMFERGIKLVDPHRKRVMVMAPMSKHMFRPVGKFERRSVLIEQNKRLLRENERLLRENAYMLEAYSSVRKKKSANKMCANVLQVSKNLKIMYENMESLK